VGEAEAQWTRCLEDLAAGRGGGLYRSGDFVDLGGRTLARPKREASLMKNGNGASGMNGARGVASGHASDVFSKIDYRDLQLIRWDKWKSSPAYRVYFHWPIMFSRGCPHPCSYCAVQAFYERSYRTRAIDAVIEDVRRIKALGGKNLLFLDDNPIADVPAAKELFARLIPEKIKWSSQCTIEIARDPELLDLAARSGCVALSIGLESNDEPVLDGMKKRFNRPSRYAEDLAALRAKGIQVIALMMLGMDGQGAGVFESTLRFLIDEKVSLVKLFTPAPYPGTTFYDEMKADGRLRWRPRGWRSARRRPCRRRPLVALPRRCGPTRRPLHGCRPVPRPRRSSGAASSRPPSKIWCAGPAKDVPTTSFSCRASRASGSLACSASSDPSPTRRAASF
jgi:radical SAM superfamily enzyme YgiQ (UPF0313 family)